MSLFGRFQACVGDGSVEQFASILSIVEDVGGVANTVPTNGFLASTFGFACNRFHVLCSVFFGAFSDVFCCFQFFEVHLIKAKVQNCLFGVCRVWFGVEGCCIWIGSQCLVC